MHEFIRNLLLITGGILIQVLSAAQEKKPLVAKAGVDINESVPVEWAYQYSVFNSARVVFRTGAVHETKLNYNWVLDEMHFTGRTGDTLSVDQAETIKYISIGSDTFYYNSGYLMQLATNNSVKLCIRQKIRLKDKHKTAAYDMPSSVSAVKNVTTFSDEGRVNRMDVNQNIVVAREEKFYFCNRYLRCVEATRKKIPSIIPSKRDAIKRYLKETTLNYQDTADLKKILRFLGEL